MPRWQGDLLHAVAESLGVYAQPLADSCDRATRVTHVGTQLEDHCHRAFPQLFGVRLP